MTLNRPAKCSLASTLTGAALRGAGLLFTPILTRLLGAEEYGVFAIYATGLSLFSALATLEIPGSATYLGLRRFKTEDRFLSSAFGLILLLSGLILLAFLPVSFAFPESFPAKWLPVYLLSTVSGAAAGLLSARARYRYDAVFPTVSALVSGLFPPLFSIALIALSPLAGEARVAAQCTAALLLGIPSALRLFARGQVFYDRKSWAFLLRFSLPLLPHYFAMMLLASADRLLIGRFCPPGSVGQYAVAYAAGMAVTIATNGLLSALGPWTMRKVAAGDFARVRETISAVFALLCPATLLFLAFAPEILALLAPAAYRDALPVVYLVSLSPLSLFLSNLSFTAAMRGNRSALLALPAVLSALVNLAGNLLFLPRYGIFFAAGATSFSYLSLALFSSTVAKLRTGAYLFPIRRFLLAIFALGGGAALLYLLREDLLPRILLGAAFCLLLLPSVRRAPRLALESKV